MVQLAQLLEKLGLSQYAKTFADNDIDGAALLQLEEAHLKELGMSMGHRLRLTKAISEMRAASDAAPKYPTSLGPTKEAGALARTAPVTAPAVGERRQLTLMFVDLVGSTQLAARADPEDVRDVMRIYQDTCAGIVLQYDGYLAKFLGDGVLAYFGYPHAREDAAERAVRAGRAIVEAVARVAPSDGHQLSVRVGIATGTVVVDTLTAPDGASELSAIGDTPNLAARLQTLAEPNTVVIGDGTRALTRGTFHYVDLGERRLKGVPYPVRAWQVTGEVIATTRFEAAHATSLGRFIGREHEVGLLHSRWEQAVSGEGQAVLLCGEPGIGKSRIAEQLRHRLQETDHTRILYQCSPFHVGSALQPAIGQLEFAAGIGGDDVDQRLTKLERLLKPTTPDMDTVVPLLAALLGIPLGPHYISPPLTSDGLKRCTLEALANQLVALSRVKPVFLLVEDAHWLDPTTHELIGLCLDRIRDRPVFMLVTFRPEFVSSWGQMPHVTSLTPNRLARRQAVELVESMCAGKSLPDEVLDQIVGKTDGVPLFIEELTKTVLESGLLIEHGGGYMLKGPLPALAIPATLHDSLMARLERLSPVKEVAQIGSAIGREFSYELIAAVTQSEPKALAEALNQLARAELVFVRGNPPDATYVFKHALVQDAAYASLLRPRRQHIHARIAQVLEEKYLELVTRHPEVLAHHCEAAGLDVRAKDLWSTAGRLALANSTYAEAINHFARALTLVAKSPPSEARTREESSLVLDRADAMMALKGPAAVEYSQLAAEALKVSAPLGDDTLHFRARWDDWHHQGNVGNLLGASERADILVAMANRIAVKNVLLQAQHARWTTAFVRGHMKTARDAIELGLALYDIEPHRDHLSMYGAHDPGTCAHGTGACTLWQTGFADRAAGLARDGIRLAEALGHPMSRTVAHYHAGFLAIMVGDVAVAGAHAEATVAGATEFNMALPAAIGRFMVGWVIARRGDLGRGADQMEAVFRNLQESKQRLYMTFLGTLLASAKLEMGRTEDVLNFLGDLQQRSAEAHQLMFRSELHRLRAEALRSLDLASARIEAEFRIARQLAREQGALALELRAASGLADWLAEIDRAKEGVSLLRPVFSEFTEGFDTPDLRAVKTMLDYVGND